MKSFLLSALLLTAINASAVENCKLAIDERLTPESAQILKDKGYELIEWKSITSDEDFKKIAQSLIRIRTVETTYMTGETCKNYSEKLSLYEGKYLSRAIYTADTLVCTEDESGQTSTTVTQRQTEPEAITEKIPSCQLNSSKNIELATKQKL